VHDVAGEESLPHVDAHPLDAGGLRLAIARSNCGLLERCIASRDCRKSRVSRPAPSRVARRGLLRHKLSRPKAASTTQAGVAIAK
jgi:hypothetical protein